MTTKKIAKSATAKWVRRVTRLCFGGLIVRDPPAHAYRVHHGWYDGREVDAVLAEAVDLIGRPETTNEQRATIWWNRAPLLWVLQRFDEAEADLVAYLPHAITPVYKGTAGQWLGAIRKRKLMHEVP
jgi:hypothetical protein